MKYCKDCYWWNPPWMFRDGKDGKGEAWMVELGECLNSRQHAIYSSRRPDDPPRSKPDDFSIGLDYNHLQCGPEFGCNHFKEKGV